MDADKSIPVVNIPPMRFICVPTKQVITGNTQGAWDPEISVAMNNTVGVLVEEDLSDIGMDFRRAVLNLKCNCEESWIK